MSGEVVKRVYDNRLRTEQAAATRHRVLKAARELFLTQGYAATSMGAIASAAGVSRETLYKVFGSKAAIIKDVYDVTVGGDEDDIPVAERPEMMAIWRTADPRSKVSALAAGSAELVGRLGPLWAMVLSGARAGDPELAQLAATSNAERLAAVEGLIRDLAGVGGLREGLSETEAVDVMWMLLSPEVWQLLVDDRGWTLPAYQRWLDQTLADALLARNADSGQ
jgi:AcrR family transcriptional regulator